MAKITRTLTFSTVLLLWVVPAARSDADAHLAMGERSKTKDRSLPKVLREHLPRGGSNSRPFAA